MPHVSGRCADIEPQGSIVRAVWGTISAIVESQLKRSNRAGLSSRAVQTVPSSFGCVRLRI